MEWISVRDRLPEDYVQVIVLLGVRQKICISSVGHQNITEADQTINNIKTWVGEANVQVTHWMPCPKIPESCLEK